MGTTGATGLLGVPGGNVVVVVVLVVLVVVVLVELMDVEGVVDEVTVPSEVVVSEPHDTERTKTEKMTTDGTITVRALERVGVMSPL